MKFKLGQEFMLNQDLDFDTSTVSITTKKETMVKIIEIDNSDGELPYKVYFEDCEEWIFMSEYELESITLSAMAGY